jgi:hypothetical protein
VILDGFSALENSPLLFIPFLALAHFARRMSRVGAATLLGLLVAGTVVTQVGVYSTENSTAAIALVLYPLLFLLGVLFGAWIDSAARDAIGYVRRHGS